jgi:hypothetical protein
MKPRRSTSQPQVTYAVQAREGGAWRTLDTFDSVTRAIGCYNAQAGRRRILQSTFDAAQRQRSAVLRDSEQDAAVEAATARKPAPVLVTKERDWLEDEDGEPIRVGPGGGPYVHMRAR